MGIDSLPPDVRPIEWDDYRPRKDVQMRDDIRVASNLAGEILSGFTDLVPKIRYSYKGKVCNPRISFWSTIPYEGSDILIHIKLLWEEDGQVCQMQRTYNYTELKYLKMPILKPLVDSFLEDCFKHYLQQTL